MLNSPWSIILKAKVGCTMVAILFQIYRDLYEIEQGGWIYFNLFFGNLFTQAHAGDINVHSSNSLDV